MEQTYFVDRNSIVRTIWGRADIILFIFAGAAGEFAVNKAVDWLFFTGKLPSDPLGRMFSTVNYAKKIVFSSLDEANNSIDTISHIHQAVEKARGASISEWAYRDVLYMLIHYSIAAFEAIERKLGDEEKEEVYNVFLRVGQRMGIADIPLSYSGWQRVREAHLAAGTQRSHYTIELFQQYRKHLGSVRFWLLVEVQKLIMPEYVKVLLGFSGPSLLRAVLPFYKIATLLRIDSVFKRLLLPKEYKKEVDGLDVRLSSHAKRRGGTCPFTLVLRLR